MTDPSTPNYTHRVYNNNPVLYKSYVDKHVTITTTDGTNVYEGIVYTIDPVSESVILVKNNDNFNFETTIIPGNSVKKIELTSKPGLNLPDFFPNNQAKKFTDTELSDKKKCIIETLKKNCLPVVDNDGVLEVVGMLKIEPPYELDNCVCNNSIILSRISKLLYDKD